MILYWKVSDWVRVTTASRQADVEIIPFSQHVTENLEHVQEQGDYGVL